MGIRIVKLIKKIFFRLLGYEEIYETVSVRIRVKGQKPKNFFEYLKHIEKKTPLPMSVESCKKASNSEIKRWLKSGSVIVNGKKPKVNDEIKLPIKELIFFPKGKRKTTYM